MKLTPLDLYKIGRKEITAIGRAIERLTEYPYGNLHERLQEWLERPSVTLLRMAS